MSTFVSVGNANQSFERLLQAVAALAGQGRLPAPVVVQYGYTPFESTVCQAIDFLSMEDFSRHVLRADLLILHAGAGSMIHACQAAKVPVVVPRRARYGEHIDDHQVELVEAFAQQGLVVRVDGVDDLEVAAQRAIKLQNECDKVPHKEPPLVGMVRETLAMFNSEVQTSKINNQTMEGK